MAIEFPQNEETSGGGNNEERKEVGSAVRWGGAYTLRKENEEELLREMFVPT